MYLPPLLFPPVAWFLEGIQYGKIIVATEGYYEKQTLRSRYTIAGPNNLQNLIVPVKHTGTKMLLQETQISRDEKWEKYHEKALGAAYRNSPFFEFYDYRVFSVLNEKNVLLIEMIEASISILHKYLCPEIPLEFVESLPDEVDFSIEKAYPQVFDLKFGFRPGLTALDLLFNLGPEAESYLLDT